MPKIRSIHPDACESEKLVGLSDGAERTLWRLTTHADDDGRGVDHPKLLANKLYPLSDTKTAEVIDGHMDELVQAGMLVRYAVQGKRYFEIHDFTDWQKPKYRSESKIPGPPVGATSSPDQDQTEGSPGPHLPHGDGEVSGDGDGAVDPSSPDGDAAAETGADDAAGHDAPPDVDRRFEDHFWPVYPPMPNGKKPEKGKALQQWRRLTLEQQRRAVIGARNLARADTIPKHAHRFLRRDTAGEFPFDDWQAASADVVARRPSDNACHLCGQRLEAHDDESCQAVQQARRIA